MTKRKYTSLAKFYDAKERYLFLGNGINQMQHGVLSWKDLLIKVCKDAKISIDLDQPKSNTLLFEEMAFAMNGGSGEIGPHIHKLKALLAKNAIDLEPHTVIAELVQSGKYQHFLTTNYDYCIEKCFIKNYAGDINKNSKRPKYSLYRFNQIDNIKIWHIHGECNNGYKGKLDNYPEASILIGFEHYADYLEKILRLVKDDHGRGLAELIENAQENWVHLFFTRDIDILGFGLDYNETHLWFLLNFRGRLIRSGARIGNAIRWIIPDFSEEKNKGKIQILQSLGVEVVLAPTSGYPDFAGTYKNI